MMALPTRLTNRTLLFTALTLVMTVYGFSITMIGPLMPSLIGKYTLRLSGGGPFATARSIGGVVAAVGGGASPTGYRKGDWLCFVSPGTVGALIGPIFSRLMLLGSGRWHQAYTVLAAICGALYQQAPPGNGV